MKDTKNPKPMQFKDLILKRFTCRKYSEESFDIDTIISIAKRALYAPSTDNRQAFRFFLMEKKHYYKVSKLISQEWALKAPYLAFLFSVPEEAYIRPYDNKPFDLIDAAIAFDHFILLLTEAGFGTAWTTSNIDPRIVVKALRLPQTWEFIAFTPIGYPLEEEPQLKDRLRRRSEELILTESPSITQYSR